MTFGSWKRWLLNGAIIIAVFLAVSAWQGKDLVSSQEPAPLFKLPTLSGDLVALEDFRGKRVLLYFFAPWCKICDLSIGNLNWVRKLRSEDSTALLSVALSYADMQSVKSFQERNTLDVPVLLGTHGMLSSYRIRAFPTVYTVNKSGEVDGSTVGYATPLGLWWRTL